MRHLVVASVTLALLLGSGANVTAEEAEGPATEAEATGMQVVPVAALLLTSLTAGVAAQPGATYVTAQDGTGDFTTITEAIEAAVDGDAIVVRPGTYTESLSIEKDISISGDGDRREIIVEYTDQSPTTDISGTPAPYGLLLRDADVVISNLTVVGPEAGIGIKVIGEASVAVEANDLIGGGIAFDGGSTGVVAGNVLRDVIGGAAIVVRGPDTSPLITDNSVTGSAIGISVGSGTEVFVRGNDLIGNEIGIATSGVDEGFVGNTITDGGVGVAVDSGAPYLEANVISGNRTGIEIGPGASPRLVGNTVCDNQTNVWLLGDAQMPDTARNDICPDAATEGRE